MTKEKYNQLSSEIIAVAIEVHKIMGPGLLESVFEQCLVFALKERNLNVESPVHEVQPVTNLKLADKKRGLLIHFNEPVLREGIVRRINGIL